MGVNRKFYFRRVWKFWWDLSNVISGGNWLFRWDCVFSGGLCTPLRTMLDSYEVLLLYCANGLLPRKKSGKSVLDINL